MHRCVISTMFGWCFWLFKKNFFSNNRWSPSPWSLTVRGHCPSGVRGRNLGEEEICQEVQKPRPTPLPCSLIFFPASVLKLSKTQQKVPKTWDKSTLTKIAKIETNQHTHKLQQKLIQKSTHIKITNRTQIKVNTHKNCNKLRQKLTDIRFATKTQTNQLT
jgi:hypothetical protein